MKLAELLKFIFNNYKEVQNIQAWLLEFQKIHKFLFSTTYILIILQYETIKIHRKDINNSHYTKVSREINWYYFFEFEIGSHISKQHGNLN